MVGILQYVVCREKCGINENKDDCHITIGAGETDIPQLRSYSGFSIHYEQMYEVSDQ